MNIDDIFKESLENHESDVNPKIWEHISGEINQVDKSPVWSIGFSKILLAGIGILIVSALCFWTLVPPNKTDSSNLPEQLMDQVNEIEVSGKDQSVAQNLINKKNQQKQTTTSVQKETKNNTVDHVITDRFDNQTKTFKQQANIKDQAYSNPVVDNTKDKTENRSTKNFTQENEEFFSNTKTNSINLFGNLILNKQNKNSYVSLGTRNHITKKTNIKPTEPSLIALEPFVIKRKAQECPSFYKDVWVPYMWTEYGNVFPQRSLEAEAGYEDYLDLRNQYEETQYSFDFAAGFGLKTPYGIFGELGLQYSQIQEKFSFTDPETIKKTQIITIDTLFMDGQIIANSDTSYIDIPGAVTIVTHNKYKFFNFPMMLGYDYGINPNFSIGVKAGAILNFSFRQKGRFVDEDNTPVWFSSSAPDRIEAFTDKISMSFMTGIQATYHLGDVMSFYASPQIKFIPKTITTDSYQIKQTYLNPALTIGIKYSIL